MRSLRSEAVERYLKGYEEKADSFGALKELTRMLPHASNAKETVRLCQLIIKSLAALDDNLGVVAWEDKLLTEFKTDRDACAGVYVDRGGRAFEKKNFPEALTHFRMVCTEYIDSNWYGDAQYDVGLVLHEQQKYDEAVVEYAKLFPSHVNDYAVDPESSDELKNYRFKAAMRISECYEAKKDFSRALEYALLARDRYKFLSWCKTCLQTVKDNLDQRITQLQTMGKKTE